MIKFPSKWESTNRSVLFLPETCDGRPEDHSVKMGLPLAEFSVLVRVQLACAVA
jgi:hypothetical protein